jgi:hypothetical protein
MLGDLPYCRPFLNQYSRPCKSKTEIDTNFQNSASKVVKVKLDHKGFR